MRVLEPEPCRLGCDTEALAVHTAWLITRGGPGHIVVTDSVIAWNENQCPMGRVAHRHTAASYVARNGRRRHHETNKSERAEAVAVDGGPATAGIAVAVLDTARSYSCTPWTGLILAVSVYCTVLSRLVSNVGFHVSRGFTITSQSKLRPAP